MKKYVLRFAVWLLEASGNTVLVNPVQKAPDVCISNYFMDTDPAEVMEAFRVIRGILIGRKLIRKDRSDKGTKRIPAEG